MTCTSIDYRGIVESISRSGQWGKYKYDITVVKETGEIFCILGLVGFPDIEIANRQHDFQTTSCNKMDLRKPTDEEIAQFIPPRTYTEVVHK